MLALETRLQRGELVGGELPPPGPARGPARRSRDLTFVGRDEELGTLSAAVGASEPGTVLVAGSAGAGKSRLVAEAAAQSELPVLAVRAFLPERNEPWGLARALLREALALDLDAARAVPDRAAQALADVVPGLEELRPIGTVVVDPESRRALALEAAARVLAAAVGKGALLVVDDLQWADATSLCLLGLAARRIPQAGMVLAYRPEEVAADGPGRRASWRRSAPFGHPPSRSRSARWLPRRSHCSSPTTRWRRRSPRRPMARPWPWPRRSGA